MSLLGACGVGLRAVQRQRCLRSCCWLTPHPDPPVCTLLILPPLHTLYKHHLREPLNHDRCDRRGKDNMPHVRQLTHAQLAHARRPSRALRASRALHRGGAGAGAGAAGATTPIAAFSHIPCRPSTNVRRQSAIHLGACQSRSPVRGVHTPSSLVKMPCSMVTSSESTKCRGNRFTLIYSCPLAETPSRILVQPRAGCVRTA